MKPDPIPDSPTHNRKTRTARIAASRPTVGTLLKVGTVVTVGTIVTVGTMIALGSMTLSAQAQKQKSGSDTKPGVTKPVPPSISNPPSTGKLNTQPDTKSKSKTAVKARPVSPQLASEAIIADVLQQVWDQTDEHFHEGEYNHVVNLSRIVVQGDPQNVEAYSNSAWLLWSTDRNDEAVEILKQGVTANPRTYYMYDELGMHYATRRRQYASALPLYEQAVKYPCPFQTWNGLANCYEKTNQWEKAVAAWEKGASIPEDGVARVRLSRAKKHLADQK